MRTAVAILIMFSLTFQCMVKMAIVGWYEMNKDYISKNLCENRGNPKMKCCGKCYLKKQLKKAGDNTDANGKQAPGKLNKIELAEFVVPQKIKFLYLAALSVRNYNPAMQHMHNHNALSAVFHPPSVA
jgi:hypothetical protein